VLLISCSGDETFLGTSDSAEGRAYQAIIDNITTLNEAASATHPYLVSQKDSSWFDPNNYFSVLTHLHPEGSTILDYVYYYDGDGRPFMYSRPDSVEPIGSYDEYVLYVTSAPENSPYCYYLDRVEAEDCDAGYFEAVLLRLLGGQFYLAWHNLYNDTRVVCSRAALEAIVDKYDFGSYERQALEIEPHVGFRYDADYAYVSLVTFTKWGGLYRREYRVSRTLPLEVSQFNSICLAHYDCGYVY